MRIFLILFLLCPKAFASEATYEEGPDCPYPSEWIEVVGKDGQVSYIVKQDPRCDE